ncbi:unnamed protein product [Closterium sp. NIES-53]
MFLGYPIRACQVSSLARWPGVGGVSSIGADAVEGPAIGVDVAVAAAVVSAAADVVSTATDVVSAVADVVFAATDVVSAAADAVFAAAEC